MAEGSHRGGPGNPVGAVILAAGASSRMGGPKQLLAVDGEPLLARTVRAVAASGVHPVAVVLGANAGSLRSQVDLSATTVVINSDWQSGMASSIAAGVSALVSLEPNLAAVLVTPCDLPGISGLAIGRIVGALSQSHRIAAARYHGRLGAPAVFGREHFPALLALRGDSGARSLLNAIPSEVSAVDAPELGADLDTPDDLLDWETRISKGHLD